MNKTTNKHTQAQRPMKMNRLNEQSENEYINKSTEQTNKNRKKDFEGFPLFLLQQSKRQLKEHSILHSSVCWYFFSCQKEHFIIFICYRTLIQNLPLYCEAKTVGVTPLARQFRTFDYPEEDTS